jgi:hypothetical protein
MSTPSSLTPLRSLVELVHHPDGPRLYVGGLRVHHGLTGSLLFLGTSCLRRHANLRALTAIAAGSLILDDAHDFPWRLRDRPCS